MSNTSKRDHREADTRAPKIPRDAFRDFAPYTEGRQARLGDFAKCLY